MLACEARPGRMWFHELMLKMVGSVPQSSNDCAFGSDFQKYSPESCYVCVLGSGRPFVGSVRLSQRRQKLGPRREVRKTLTVYPLFMIKMALCFFLVNTFVYGWR